MWRPSVTRSAKGNNAPCNRLFPELNRCNVVVPVIAIPALRTLSPAQVAEPLSQAAVTSGDGEALSVVGDCDVSRRVKTLVAVDVAPFYLPIAKAALKLVDHFAQRGG